MSATTPLKSQVHTILTAEAGGVPGKSFDAALIVLIVANVAAVVLETVPGLHARYATFFAGFEAFSAIVFTIEYLLRLWACGADRRYARSVRGRLRYVLTPMALVDLMAILPFYLPLLLLFDLRFLRALRLFRLMRVFKLGRYSEAMQTMARAVRSKREELLVAGFAVLILLVVASSLIYFVENKAQPDIFSSNPAAMWWGVVTLTTVGYGDIYPVTVIGRLLGGPIAVLGIGLFALPAGILGAGFIEEMQKKQSKKTCPHCGKEL